MPLSEKARIEVYVPDLPPTAYLRLLEALESEFTYTFGGCTVQHGLNGHYLSLSGQPILDRVNLIYTDIPYSFTHNFALLSRFADELRARAAEALEEEEAILVVISPVYHPE